MNLLWVQGQPSPRSEFHASQGSIVRHFTLCCFFFQRQRCRKIFEEREWSRESEGLLWSHYSVYIYENMTHRRPYKVVHAHGEKQKVRIITSFSGTTLNYTLSRHNLWVITKICFKTAYLGKWGTREMAQWLTALSVKAEDLDLIPASTWWPITTHLMSSSDLKGNRNAHGTQIHMLAEDTIE